VRVIHFSLNSVHREGKIRVRRLSLSREFDGTRRSLEARPHRRIALPGRLRTLIYLPANRNCAMSLQPKILIVEDEETLAQNMRDYLRKRMVDARIVASGEAALDCVADFGPDLLVLDYGLPGMDGLKTFAALRTQQVHLGAVLVTGHPTEQILQAATEAGIRHVLAKPFAFSDLERVLLASLRPLAPRDRDERRSPNSRRTGERRHVNDSTRFPVHTHDGGGVRGQRQNDRRTLGDRRRPVPRRSHDVT